jgi:hypothetical protein
MLQWEKLMSRIRNVRSLGLSPILLSPVLLLSVLALPILANFLVPDLAHAQPGPPAALDDAARGAAVESAAKALRSRYVSPDLGERAAAAIESALAKGDYAGLVQPKAFADRLTADLQAVTADKHVQVLGPGAGPGAQPTNSGASPSPPPRSEGGVTRADRLAGNIGYIEIVALGPPPALFDAAVDRALASLADTKALIVDARSAAGGTIPSVSYLVSCFLDGEKRVHISDVVTRNPGTETFRTQESWSVPTRFSYTGKPVYVLTSGDTLSGGEAFAYDMQAMKLGVLVGETTAGAANAAGLVPLAPGLLMMLSVGRTQNTVTGTNWEGAGVKPDIAATRSEALVVVLEQLGAAPSATDIDALSEARVFAPRSTPQPGGEAAVRRMSEENARGEPNYDLLSPEMANATRVQLEGLKKTFTELGPIKSVKFVNVGPMGADVYEAEYANGSLTWQIVLTPDGKTATAGVRRH